MGFFHDSRIDIHEERLNKMDKAIDGIHDTLQEVSGTLKKIAAFDVKLDSLTTSIYNMEKAAAAYRADTDKRINSIENRMIRLEAADNNRKRAFKRQADNIDEINARIDANAINYKRIVIWVLTCVGAILVTYVMNRLGLKA